MQNFIYFIRWPVYLVREQQKYISDGTLVQSGPKVIKLFSCSTQLSMKFILLINVKMPTIVGILTFISMIITTSKSWKARNVFIFKHFSIY